MGTRVRALGVSAVVLAGGLGLAASALTASACKRTDMASPAECERLLDRFIDLKLSENVAARAMSTEDRAHLRARIATDVLGDSDVQQVKNQCETEVTQAEYDCAIKASSSRAWNDCIQ